MLPPALGSLYSPVCPSLVSAKVKGLSPTTADSRMRRGRGWSGVFRPHKSTASAWSQLPRNVSACACLCTADTTKGQVTRTSALDYQLKIWNWTYTVHWKTQFKSPRPFVHSIYTGCKMEHSPPAPIWKYANGCKKIVLFLPLLVSMIAFIYR